LTVFFTDRDLGTRFPDILAAAGLTVERHQNHFRQDCPDEEWLQAIGQKEWVAITHDTRIRYKPNERDAVIRNRVKHLLMKIRRDRPFLGSLRASMRHASADPNRVLRESLGMRDANKPDGLFLGDGFCYRFSPLHQWRYELAVTP
jgi:hypothetical protein